MKMAITLALASLALIAGSATATVENSLRQAGDNRGEIRGFLEKAEKKHGEFGRKAATFLVSGMPERDLRALKEDFLLENLELALKARKEFPWAQAVPEEVFFNDVLPYASLDETRESWRPDFYERAKKVVQGCRSATEAAQALNRDFFKQYQVHYNTGRKKPNQSPSESKKLGMATCTGLSIILVDACRAVGVPARVAGIPLWPNKRGNHTWVEIYDDGQWFFTGADEYREGQPLNKAWFENDASKAIAEDWRHSIWATSWKKTGTRFPMVWALDDQSVAGVNVTKRYQKDAPKTESPLVPVHLRVFDKNGGERIAADIALLENGAVKTSVTSKAGTADLNDMATVRVRPGKEFRLRLSYRGQHKTVILTVDKETTRDLFWNELQKEAKLAEITTWLALLPEERHLSVPARALSKKEAAKVSRMVFDTLKKELREERKDELKRRKATQDGAITFGVVKAAKKEMRILERQFGKAPEGGPSLWISMHGGGGAPPQVNDQQWKNQIMLYEPKEGIYIAPRAPTNEWNLWHEEDMDALLDRTIENYVLSHGIDPDRVYLMGYSAGGDGVYKLAPRMADRFAAASMMAGHPNGQSMLGLRNLPFMIWMGEKDGAYKRNETAVQWGKKLDDLQKGDPEGYDHETHIVKGKGHWMDREDAAAVPWMAARTRNPWPKKVVWEQGDRFHDRFYWLALPKGISANGQTIRAEVKGQHISLQTKNAPKLQLRLSDRLVNLDEEIVVTLHGKEAFRGKVNRQTDAIFSSLKERLDIKTAATAILTVGE